MFLSVWRIVYLFICVAHFSNSDIINNPTYCQFCDIVLNEISDWNILLKVHFKPASIQITDVIRQSLELLSMTAGAHLTGHHSHLLSYWLTDCKIETLRWAGGWWHFWLRTRDEVSCSEWVCVYVKCVYLWASWGLTGFMLVCSSGSYPECKPEGGRECETNTSPYSNTNFLESERRHILCLSGSSGGGLWVKY